MCHHCWEAHLEREYQKTLSVGRRWMRKLRLFSEFVLSLWLAVLFVCLAVCAQIGVIVLALGPFVLLFRLFQ